MLPWYVSKELLHTTAFFGNVCLHPQFIPPSQTKLPKPQENKNWQSRAHLVEGARDIAGKVTWGGRHVKTDCINPDR